MRAVGKSRQEACRRKDKGTNTTGRRWEGVETQEMKGKEGSGDPEGREAKSGLASSGRGLDTSREKGFFADVHIISSYINIR